MDHPKLHIHFYLKHYYLIYCKDFRFLNWLWVLFLILYLSFILLQIFLKSPFYFLDCFQNQNDIIPLFSLMHSNHQGFSLKFLIFQLLNPDISEFLSLWQLHFAQKSLYIIQILIPIYQFRIIHAIFLLYHIRIQFFFLFDVFHVEL